MYRSGRGSNPHPTAWVSDALLAGLPSKIFRRKDITLTRNRVIRICIQNTLVPPIAGYF